MTMKIQAPIELEMKIGITDGEGTFGVVTLGLGHGSYKSEEEMRAALLKFEKEQMPAGFRLQSKKEWWECVCAEKFGVLMAMPGNADYD